MNDAADHPAADTPAAAAGDLPGSTETDHAGWAPSTIAVTAGRPDRVPDAPLNSPLVPASTYVAGGDREYGRYANPTWEAFEAAVGELEGGRALAYASGLAAVAAIVGGVPPGGLIVAPRHAYLGTLGQLERLAATGRARYRFVDIADTAAVLDACTEAAMLWIESPTNPAIEVADIPALCAGARAAGAVTVVDNTFATPLLQRPLDLGADLVLHSATKFLSGHADAVLGVAVTRGRQTFDTLLAHRKLAGAIPGTLETWLALRGLRTLHLRIERASTNARELATRLDAHPRVERVRYPGLAQDPGFARAERQMSAPGAVLSIEIAGGAEAADEVTRRSRVWVNATSLGGVESTFERRRRWSTESKTIPENLIRLSVGVEDIEDLWADLELALRV